MNTELSNRVSIKMSQKIFNELMKGQIINEYNFDDKTNDHIINDLFIELRDNIKDYTMQYKMSGMNLVQRASYFYLEDKSNTSDKQPVKTKVYAAIIILVRYLMNDSGKLFDYIQNKHNGLKLDDIKDIEENINYLQMLKASKIDSSESLIRTLFERNLLLKINDDRFILSDSGKDLVQEIVNTYKLN